MNNVNSKINSSSLKTYCQNVKKLGIDLNSESEISLESLEKIKDLDFIKSSLQNIVNLNTKCNVLMAVIWYIRNDNRIFEADEKIEAELYALKLLNSNKHLLEERNYQKKENKFKENDKYKDLKIELLQKKFISSYQTFEDGLEISNSTLVIDPRKVIHLLQQYFLVSLYLFSPPLRNNYIHLIYLKSAQMFKMNDSNNYLIDHGAHVEIILNSYKTKKAYGVFKFKLSEISTIIFFRLREFKNYKNGDYIIYNTTTKKPFNVNSTKIISDASKAVLNIKLSCNAYRHMYVIELLNSDKYKNMTVNEKEALARSMCHSFYTSQLYNRIQ